MEGDLTFYIFHVTICLLSCSEIKTQQKSKYIEVNLWFAKLAFTPAVQLQTNKSQIS